jgi:hypothetical protein
MASPAHLAFSPNTGNRRPGAIGGKHRASPSPANQRLALVRGSVEGKPTANADSADFQIGRSNLMLILPVHEKTPD